MRERPILFSAPMVRAILNGSKTQTRRVVKPQPMDNGGGYECDLLGANTYPGGVVTERGYAPPDDFFADMASRCPYGAPGDRLWVKEAIRCFEWMDGGETSVEYVATPGVLHEDAEWVWKRDTLPGMFMPRGLSRLTLTITDVRVERLQAISEVDAKAEGLATLTKDGGRTWKHGIPDRDGLPGNDDRGWQWNEWCVSPVDAYQKLWDSLNAARGFGWDANPWVWVVSFTRDGRGEAQP